MLYFLTDALVLGCINAIMVVGLNLQYGYGGLLNFAFYIYVAVGAYIAAITTMGPSTVPGISYALGWTLPWWAGLLLGGLVAAVLGGLVFLLTVRRLRSDYLAIVTVAVAFIIWNLIDTYQPLFDGDTGLFNVPQITRGREHQHRGLLGDHARPRGRLPCGVRLGLAADLPFAVRPAAALHPRGRAGDLGVRPGHLETADRRVHHRFLPGRHRRRADDLLHQRLEPGGVPPP
jgi:branched-subunit amino acid ABC-type transport system permease component